MFRKGIKEFKVKGDRNDMIAVRHKAVFLLAKQHPPPPEKTNKQKTNPKTKEKKNEKQKQAQCFIEIDLTLRSFKERMQLQKIFFPMRPAFVTKKKKKKKKKKAGHCIIYNGYEGFFDK